jgi:hypothetical protein
MTYTCPGLNFAMYAPGTILGFAFVTEGAAAEDEEAASTARTRVETRIIQVSYSFLLNLRMICECLSVP